MHSQAGQSRTLDKKGDGYSLNRNMREIANEQVGQRLDNFLFCQFKNAPRSHIYKIIRGGEVRVNGRRVKPFYRLDAGDRVRIPPTLLRQQRVMGSTLPPQRLIRLITTRIIHEDDALLVLNKPAALASHGGSGINFGVIELLRAAYPKLSSLALVHRLDRETTGCLLVAKKRSALRELHSLLRTGEISKIYWLLVRGAWQGDERLVRLPLQKKLTKTGERLVRVAEEGKGAVTIFRPLWVSDEISLVEAELQTGRTHQIRVHAAHLGYPIVGDEKYGDRQFNRVMKIKGWSSLCLHARKISFVWQNGVKKSFLADPEREWRINLPSCVLLNSNL